jgi:hypothetical protein
MSTNGAQIAWALTRFAFGLLLWCLAALFVFVLVDGSMPSWASILVVALVMLGLPTLLTRLLLPAFRRMGDGARWAELWPGLCGVVALLALVVPLVFARSFVARKAGEFSSRRRDVAPWVKRASDTLARWLAPSASDNGRSDIARDAGVSVDSSVEAGGATARDAAETRDASETSDALSEASIVDDASDDVMADVGDEASSALEQDDAGPSLDDAGALDDDEPLGMLRLDASTAALDPASPNTVLHEFVRFEPCSQPGALWVGELALGGTDELVVTCGESVRVYFLQNDALFERTVFAPSPNGLEVFMQRAVVTDIDGDGRRDLGFCAHFTSQRGGTRGGGVWWARGKSNGQFEAPRALIPGGLDCSGMDFGDVTGDGRPELLVAKTNNGYAATNAESELRWYTGQGAQWTQRGRVRLSRGAWGLWLEDVTRDGILDVIVHTGWDGASRNWVIAGARRGPSSVVEVEDVGSERRVFMQAQGRFDGDRFVDAAAIEASGIVLRRTSQGPTARQTTVTRALDFEEFRF